MRVKIPTFTPLTREAAAQVLAGYDELAISAAYIQWLKSFTRRSYLFSITRFNEVRARSQTTDWNPLELRWNMQQVEMAAEYILAQVNEDERVNMNPVLDAVWFNDWITNTPDDVSQLCRMPYREYLKTSHWRNVRNAMLMLYGCRCQGARCTNLDSYYGDEELLDVHHLTYANRGHERFADLALLCLSCHRLQHVEAI